MPVAVVRNGDPAARALVGDDGVAVATYLAAEQSWGHAVERLTRAPGATSDDVASLVLRDLRGTVVGTTDRELAGALLTRGASLRRRGLQMERDVVASPPDPAWQWATGDGVHLRGVEVSMADRLAAAMESAYPPDHPDHAMSDPGDTALGDLLDMLAGDVTGPLIPEASAVAETDDGAVAGLVLVTRFGPSAGFAETAWIPDIFVVPAAQRRGIGQLLGRHALAGTAAAGQSRLGLSVSEGNAALRLYLALGFRVVERFVSMRIR
jgi:ribosomal protein S18 acetylase RimI-like enzyme